MVEVAVIEAPIGVGFCADEFESVAPHGDGGEAEGAAAGEVGQFRVTAVFECELEGLEEGLVFLAEVGFGLVVALESGEAAAEEVMEADGGLVLFSEVFLGCVGWGEWPEFLGVGLEFFEREDAFGDVGGVGPIAGEEKGMEGVDVLLAGEEEDAPFGEHLLGECYRMVVTV